MSKSILITDTASRQEAMMALADLDLAKQWDFTVEPHRKRRTRSQNALYWAWVDEIAVHVSEHTGYEKDEVHEYFKQRFLPTCRRVVIDNVSASHWTTKDLDTAQMAEYMDRIYRWASTELGLTLPLPPPQTEQRQ